MSQSTPWRRDKPVLSCSFCRGRKLRCDRQSPCSACLRHGKPTECVYRSSEQERKDAVDYRPHAGRQQARQRVARLENLVTRMRDQEQGSRHASANTAPADKPLHGPAPFLAPHDDRVADSVGRLSINDYNAVYIGSTHWGTILEEASSLSANIQSLKDELLYNDSDASISREWVSFDVNSIGGSPAARISLLSGYPSLSKEQILDMIPPRQVVDRHVSHFFNEFDFASCILHKNIFFAEYSNFWIDPAAAPIMWVGLLFSVMSISAFLQQQDVGAFSPTVVEAQKTLETYRTFTIHCLIAGDYLRPARYTIETLILHFAVEQNMNFDADVGNWILIGVVIRIALRMGLHRDPSHWPNIRPLEAEFRRRLWITLYHLDFFTSTQVGLPRIIKDSQCDVLPPTNLFDDDLSLEHKELPAERPLTDPTSLSYIIIRQTIIKVAAEIYDATEAGPLSSAAVAVLSAKLEKAINSIPEQLKYRPLATSIADRPVTILHRMFIDILIHKAIYLLHRRYFMKGLVGEEIAKSSELCISAALTILEHQRRMSEESQPGGIMFSIRWKVASSLNHEFLQATMMLCFAVNSFNEGNVGPTNSYALSRRDEIIDALTIAIGLWEKQANRSVEARKAVTTVRTVLKQDFEESSPPTPTAVDDQEAALVRNEYTTVNHSTRGFEQVPGLGTQSYLIDFHFGQNQLMDPVYSTVDADMTAFGVLWDDFVAEPIEN